MGVRAHPTRPPPVRFRRLIEASSEWAGQRAVVLVDEYDKPILDALDVPDIARASPRLHLIGVEFSRETRTLAAFDVEPA